MRVTPALILLEANDSILRNVSPVRCSFTMLQFKPYIVLVHLVRDLVLCFYRCPFEWWMRCGDRMLLFASLAIPFIPICTAVYHLKQSQFIFVFAVDFAIKAFKYFYIVLKIQVPVTGAIGN